MIIQKYILAVIILFTGILPSDAQNCSPYNIPRAGDELYKQQVEYID